MKKKSELTFETPCNLGKLCIKTEVIYSSVMKYTLLRYLRKQPKNFTALIAFQNRPEIRREENKVEFLEGRFLDEKLPFLHKKKAEHSFELSLSTFLSFNGVFLSLKCRTLVLKHLHGDRPAAIVLKIDICH